jgi:hypothetical protein
MWTEAQWQKRLADERAAKARKRQPYFGTRRAAAVTGSKDKFSLDNLPSPGPGPRPQAEPAAESAGTSGEAIVPEVVEPEIVEPEGIRHACPLCLKGDLPHRGDKGHFRPGHSNGFGRPKDSKASAQKIAADELNAAAPKAVRTLVKALDSPIPWLALTAARTICERAIPAEVAADAARGPLLIFPPGTKMAVMAEVADPGPASMASIGERGARSVYGGGPPKLEEQEQDVEPDLER